MAYTPPAYNGVNFDFVSTYTAPVYNGVDFRFQPVIAPTGWDSSSYGTATITSVIAVAGLGDEVFGSATAYNNIGIIDLAGYGWWDPLRTYHVGPTTFYANQDDIGDYSSGTGLQLSPITDIARTLPTNGWDSSEFGAPQINVIQVTGIDDGAFGTPTLSFIVYPSGYSDEAFGSGSIDFLGSSSSIDPTGFSDEAFGTAALSGVNHVTASGIAAIGFGVAHIDYAQHPISVVGINGFAFGSGTFVDFGVRYRTPDGIAPKGFGTASVTFFDRTVDQSGYGIAPKGFGTAFVADGQRYLYPTGVGAYGFGRPLVDFTPIVVGAIGFDAGAFGAATIHDNTQDINHLGLNSFASGDAFVAHDPQPIVPLGIQDFNTSPAHVYNLKQIIYPYFDTLSSEREEFGHPAWMTIENVNRSIGPTGFIGRLGRPTVENAAVPLNASGFDAISFGSGTFISDANRTVTPTDEIVGYFGQWASVTKPPELYPTGFQSSVFGTASIVNLNRTFAFTGFSDETVGGGDTFVDFAIRYLHPPLGPEGFYGMPDVQLKTRYIATTGFTPNFLFGAPDVTIHFNIIYTHGVNFGHTGLEHRIYNSTPRIEPYGYDIATYGAAQVRNEREFKAVQGFNSLLFGVNDISYRTKTLAAHGINSFRPGLLHIYNDTPDPPGQQYINPLGLHGEFGSASVHRNQIDVSLFDAIHFGLTEVHLMGAANVGLGEHSAFGHTQVVGPQYVTVPSTPAEPGVDDRFGDLRVDPFTIWCTQDIPPNPAGNPGRAWELIDYYLDPERTNWDLFGHNDIQNSRRYITNLHDSTDEVERYGLPLVDFYHRFLRPAGIKPPYIVGPGLNYPQTINIDDFHDGIPSQETFDSDDGDRLFVDYAPPYTKTIRPNTWLSQGLGIQRIELLNRELLPTGWDSSIMLAPHRVGYPIPMDAGLGDLTVFGDGGFVSYRNRDLPLDGWDDFLSEYDLENFAGRMRVTRSPHVGIAARGFDAGSFGSPGVRIGGPVVDIAFTDVLFDS